MKPERFRANQLKGLSSVSGLGYENRVYDSMLAGARCDPCLSKFGVENRTLCYDTPSLVVNIRGVSDNSKDF